jgi:hypothetical protein
VPQIMPLPAHFQNLSICYPLTILVFDAMKFELFSELLNKPQINKIHLHLLCNHFSSEFTTKVMYALTVYTMRAICFAHVIILFHLITLLIKVLYNFVSILLSSGPNIFFSDIFQYLKKNKRTHHMNFYSSLRSSSFFKILYYSERRTMIHSQYVHSLEDCHG